MGGKQGSICFSLACVSRFADANQSAGQLTNRWLQHRPTKRRCQIESHIYVYILYTQYIDINKSIANTFEIGCMYCRMIGVCGIPLPHCVFLFFSFVSPSSICRSSVPTCSVGVCRRIIIKWQQHEPICLLFC